jgi:hypothetical protein
MSRKILAPILLVLAVFSIGYAIYRSTAPTITTVGAAQQTVYGEPQHGLTLGLCIFAGMCVLAAARLTGRTKEDRTVQSETPQRTYTNRTATNYPQ